MIWREGVNMLIALAEYSRTTYTTLADKQLDCYLGVYSVQRNSTALIDTRRYLSSIPKFQRIEIPHNIKEFMGSFPTSFSYSSLFFNTPFLRPPILFSYTPLIHSSHI